MMTIPATSDPRYPIGKFVAPTAYGAELVADAQRRIALLPDELRAAVAGLDDVQLDTPYRDGGWTVRQVVHHLPDSHLNSYTRFRLALTEDAPVIKPYAESRWAELPDARTMPVEPSLQLLTGLHARWTALLASLTPEQWQRTFVHPEHQRVFPLWHTAGLYAWHGRHHTAQITALRKARGW